MASERSHQGIRRTMLVLAAAALALLTAGAGVAAAKGGSSVADHLRSIEKSRLHALVDADTTTARKLIAPDFQLVNPGGGTSNRKDYMDAVKAGAIDYLVFAPSSPIVVRLNGRSAGLRFMVDFDLVVGGDTRVTHKAWITELWERQHGRWLIEWEQATAIPNDFGLFIQSIMPPS